MGMTQGILTDTTSSAGWSSFTHPGAPAKIYYIDNSIGSDTSFDGLSPTISGGTGPFRTVAKALTLVLSGQGDWVLFRRGQTFTGNSASMFGTNGVISKSGKDADNLLLFSSYTTTGWSPSTPRGDVTTNETNPLISWTAGAAFNALIYSDQNNGGDYSLDYVGFVGIDFTCPGNTNTYFLTTVIKFHKFVLEDCGFIGVAIQFANPGLGSYNDANPFIMRRCVQSGVFANIGLLISGTLTNLLEENTWYKNGWENATTRNPNDTWHNVYGNYRAYEQPLGTHHYDTTTPESWTYNCNISAYSGCAGLRQRQGGTVYNNFLPNNAQDVDWGTSDNLMNASASRLCSYNVAVENFFQVAYLVGSTAGVTTPLHTWTVSNNIAANWQVSNNVYSMQGGINSGESIGLDVDATNQCLNNPGTPLSYLLSHTTGNTIVAPVTDLTGKDYTNMTVAAYATANGYGSEAAFWTALIAQRRYNWNPSVFHANTINNWMRAKALMAPVNLGGGTAPSNISPPIIGGAALVGQILNVVSAGTWNGDPTITFTYQWKFNGVVILGATNTTFTLTTAQLGTTVTCVVTATNGTGSAQAISNGIFVPAPAALARLIDPDFGFTPGFVSTVIE